MSELTRRINNELEKEQLKSEQLSNVSVTAKDLLGIASNNDKVLLSAIDNAYDSVNANPTLANIDIKMKGLMEIKPQAVLNETKTYFNVAINNLNSQKELLAQKNNAIADIYDQINSFDATDKESASSVLNLINQGVRTGLLTSEQLTNARKAVTDKFDAVETDRKLVEIDNFTENIAQYYSAGGVAEVQKQMGDAVTRTGDPKFGSVLQSYANAFMDDLNKITKMEIEAGADINYSKQVAFYNSQKTEYTTSIGSAQKSFDRYYLNTEKGQEFLDFYGSLAKGEFGKYGSPAATQMDALNVEGMHKDQLRELKMLMNTFKIPKEIQNNFELGKDAIDNIDDPNHRFYVLQTTSALANHFASLAKSDRDYAKLRTLTTALHNKLSGMYNYSTSAFGYGGNWGNGNRIQTKATRSKPTSSFRNRLSP